MTLSQIIEASAARMQDVTVHMVTNYGTVTISTPGQEDIFLQDDAASTFLCQVENLWHTTQTLSRATIALHLAEPYTDVWS